MEKYNYEGEKFLAKLYTDMHLRKEVEHASLESDKKNEKIRKYLEREERVHQKAIERGKLDLLKKAYYDKYVIKEVPLKYLDFLDKNQFDLTGHHLTKEEKEEQKLVIIEDQKKSLDNWIDYLTSEDARFYPWWAKYWAFQGMLKIGAHDNENGIYSKRDETTVAPFIELNQEALAKAIDLVMKEVKQENIESELSNLVRQGSFTKLYQILLKKQKDTNYDTKDIEGKWIKYEQGENYQKLWESLQGYNTGWCTAGEETCKRQIENGDFYVYYTKDKAGEYKIPRLAIRMDGTERIGEIRGVAKGQNVESHLEDVLDKKLENFEDREAYKRRINDSKMITYIYTKYEHNKELTKEDLNFIYEVDRQIEGFGYRQDSRIEEIKQGRNKRKDLAKMYECKEEEIGLNEYDFRKANEKGIRLKCYLGNLDLDSLKSTKGIKLPEIMQGNLILSRLKSAKGLELPEIVQGNLILSSLKNAEGLKLPEKVEYLNLNSLKSAEGLEFPEKTKILDLNSLKSAEGLELPKRAEYLDLNSLENAEGLELPEKVGQLELNSLKSAKDIKFPKEVEYLELNSLESAEGLEFPEKAKILELKSLKNAKDIKFPKEVRILDLNSLKNAEGLKLPERVKYLNLNSLESVKGLEFSEKVGHVQLNSLKSAKGIKFPKEAEEIGLNNLENVEGLELPEKVKILDLSSLKSAEGLELPEKVEMLDLSHLESAEGLELPEGVEYLDLSHLESAKGLELPKEVEVLILIRLKSAEGLKLPNGVKKLDLFSLKSAEGLELPEKVEFLDLSHLESAEGLELPNGIDMNNVDLPDNVKEELLFKTKVRQRSL